MAEQKQVYNKELNEARSLKYFFQDACEWANYLLRKWYFILAFCILGGLVGYWYAASKNPVYTATTTFVLETNDRSGSSQFAGLAAMAGIDLSGSGGGLFQGENIIELYKSRTMISKTLLASSDFNGKSQLLIDRYIEGNGLRKAWQNKPELKGLQFNTSGNYANPHLQLLHDSIMSGIVKDIVQNSMTIGRIDRKMNIVKVDIKSGDELFAKAFNKQLVQTVNEFYLQTKTKRSLDNIAILQHKTDSVKGVMTGSIYRAAQVVDITPNLNPTRLSQRTAPIQTAQASADVNKNILSQLVQNLELSKIALQKETPLIQVVDEPILPLDKEELGKKKALVLGGLSGGIFILFLLVVVKVVKENLQ